MPLIVMVFALSYTTAATANQLMNTVIFFMLFLAALAGLILLKQNTDFPIKWSGNLSRKNLIVTGIGAVSVILVAYFLTSRISPLIIVGIAGAIMFAVLFITRSILSPIMIHGTYNTVVIAMSMGIIGNIFLSGSPIQIPLIGLQFGNLDLFTSQSVFQFVLVAPAEEFVKLAAASGLSLGLTSIVGLAGRWSNYAGAAFSVVLWSLAHGILSLKVS